MYPPELAESPDGVYGNQEKFFESVENGFQAAHWERAIKKYEDPKDTVNYILWHLQDAVIPGCL